MAIAQRRVFRIEKYAGRGVQREEPATVKVQNGHSSVGTGDVLAAIAELKAEIAELKKARTDETGVRVAAPAVAPSGDEWGEAAELRSDLKDIHLAIEKTKKEIVSLHAEGVNAAEFTRMTDELGAVVVGTENATEAILSSAENIEQLASNLAAAITDESTSNMACDIQDHVVKIFEACNFQDVTGQRVTKVIAAFQFIEQRVHHMMEIWGGKESFADIEAERISYKTGDRALLSGPALESDEDVASQTEIDALFN